MSTEFGDIELADAWDLAPPAADQITYRLHELRRAVNNMAGIDTGPWELLTHDEQDIAFSLGQVIVAWLIANEPNNPALLAEYVHGVRVILSHHLLEPWRDLSNPERQISIDLMRLLTEWLARQGPY